MKANIPLALAAAVFLAACQSSETPRVAQPTADVAPTPTPSPTRTFEIKGMTLGDSQAKLMAEFPGAECATTPAGITSCVAGPVSYGGSKSCILDALFEGGEAKSIEVTRLDKDKFDLAISAMKTKFGPADDATHRPVIATRGEITWSGAGGRLLVASRTMDERRGPGVALIDVRYLQAKQHAMSVQAAQDI